MKGLWICLFAALLCAPAFSVCTPTGFYRDGINLTAALINPASVPVTVDATGCNIGIYFETGTGTVADAHVFGANYFGVMNRHATVNITNSTIYNISEATPNGTQHGVAIYFVEGGDGRVEGNTVYGYQKGGIVITGVGTKATVANNTVTGFGPIAFIAQNGIQVSRGAAGEVTGNIISGNAYTACSNQDAAKTGCIPWVSAGLLLYDIEPKLVKRSNNKFRDNQRNELLLTSQSLHSGI